MPSVTRQPAGQDLVCLVCHKQAQDIDHVVNRGMGGSKERDVPENKVPLCRECHTAKTNNVLETAVIVEPGNTLAYRWRRKGAGASWITVPVEVSNRHKCLVAELSDGAEAAARTPAPPSGPSAPSLSPKEESDESAIQSVRLSSGDSVRGDSQQRNVAGLRSAALTHEQRVAIAKDIKDTEWNRQWIAGDYANAWRAELGEEAEQYLSDFGYVELSLANIMRVCERIPPPLRNAALRFSHHVVVSNLSPETIMISLTECEDAGWSVAEFRRQVKGTKPKVKRWSEEQIEEYKQHHSNLEACHRSMATPCPYCPVVDELIRWLGERG